MEKVIFINIPGVSLNVTTVESTMKIKRYIYTYIDSKPLNIVKHVLTEHQCRIKVELRIFCLILRYRMKTHDYGSPCTTVVQIIES